MAKNTCGHQKGEPKTGGRVKGTPNKVTSITKSAIAQLLAQYNDSGQMSEDFKLLEPKDRLVIAEKMMQYIMPKMQATAVDINTQNGVDDFEKRLAQLAGDTED